jgi:hypothetical protein
LRAYHPLELAVGDAEHDEVVGAVVGEAEAEQAHRLRVAAVEAAGDALRVEQDVLTDEHEPERRQAEVDAAQPPGDRAEQRARHAGDDDGADRGEHRRQPESARRVRDPRQRRLTGEVAVAVGADGDVERVGERELAGDADEQREPDRADRRRHREQPGLQPESLGVLREPEQERDEAEHRDAPDQPAARLRHG